ncbi:hypothetical protein P3T43_006946 [Paraburkholderia sp. GAS41]|uniref:hypothetical protein n=1 Tax=Paraburkholderia sp. GAS41 TaxID=3035134 RepID=UPI003D1EE734
MEGHAPPSPACGGRLDTRKQGESHLRGRLRSFDRIRVEAHHLVADPLVKLFKAPLQGRDFVRTEYLGGRVDRFGNDAVPGTKAVAIQPLHNRRKTDVLIAVQHRKFHRFTAIGNDEQVSGICFFKSDGIKIVNYPKLHRENLAKKNQQTNEWLKHIVRIFKNARQEMIDQSILEPGQAPSYYLEGLLYNVPVDRFGNTYADSVVKCINWLLQADRASFLCANKQYRLLDDAPDVSWNTKDCDAFLTGLVQLWKGW